MSASHQRERPAAWLRTRGPSAAVVAVLALFGTGQAAGRRYHNDALRIVDFEIPRGWSVSSASPYPGILMQAAAKAESRPIGDASGAELRLVLAAQKVVPGTAAVALAADSRIVLAKKRYVDARVEPLSPGPVGEERVLLLAMDPDGQELRQAYVVESDLLVVLTMTSPPFEHARAGRDFDAALLSLTIGLRAAGSAGDGGDLPPDLLVQPDALPPPGVGAPPSPLK